MRFCAAHSGTLAGVPWNGVDVPFSMKAGTPKRLPFSDPGLRNGRYGPRWASAGALAVTGSSGSAPCITASVMAASVTVRAMGPVLSSIQSRGAMPAILTSPRVG